MLDFSQYEALTFDCYGTLIDWETGIIAALDPVLKDHGVSLAPDELLERYAAIEARIEAGPFKNYKSVLQEVLRNFGEEFGFTPSDTKLETFSLSVRDWPAFPDSTEALKALQRRYRLVILSNIDDDLFASSAHRLQIEFDEVITAEQVRSYKPAPDHFRTGSDRLGLPQEKILHVAQSLYHDILPAKRIGLDTVWVNRRLGHGGFGATPPAEAQADLEVPDLATLVSIIASQ
ncbi:haloacid dehalogenase type II [bacterium]|nr:haloacid dehalogenase type II [bacterium]